MLRGSYRNCIYTAYTQQCREGPTETASIQHTRNDAERLLRKLPLHRTHATMPRGSCGNCLYTAHTRRCREAPVETASIPHTHSSIWMIFRTGHLQRTFLSACHLPTPQTGLSPKAQGPPLATQKTQEPSIQDHLWRLRPRPSLIPNIITSHSPVPSPLSGPLLMFSLPDTLLMLYWLRQ